MATSKLHNLRSGTYYGKYTTRNIQAGKLIATRAEKIAVRVLRAEGNTEKVLQLRQEQNATVAAILQRRLVVEQKT